VALEPKQEAFITEYIKCRNAAEAARRAGYSEKTARFIGAENLTKPNILKEIEERTKANGMGLDEALSRLADFARADLGQWTSDDGEIDIAAMKRDGATHMLRKIKRTRRSGTSPSGAEWEEVTVDVELHDAKDANKFVADLHSRGPSGKEGDPFHVKVIEGPKDVR
jgi:phage terminase small subunit